MGIRIETEIGLQNDKIGTYRKMEKIENFYRD